MTAMFKLKVDTSGLKEWQDKAAQAFPKIVKKHAFVMQGKAQKGAPVDTGALKNSIIAEGKTDTLWIVTDGVEYGVFQELGTSRGITARHFLGNAAESVAKDFFDDIEGALK